MDMATATAADFTPLLHESFILDENSDDLFTLVEVESRTAAGDNARSAFTLVFRAAKGIEAPQGIFQLSHPATGTLDIFLVPVGTEDEHMMYQAVFA